MSDPTLIPSMLFDERYIPEPNSGCWLWEGCVNDDGYGRIGSRGHRYIAHRLSWILHRGAIPSGMCVLHKCDTPACVNPDHLFLGTRHDNARDMVRKSRHLYRPKPTPRPGEANPQAKLTEEDVRAIRLDARLLSIVAKAYGISDSQVSNIRLRKKWRHLS